MEKIPTGIPGLDVIAEGGLPKNRSTLVTGSAGSARTVFAAQFLAGGIRVISLTSFLKAHGITGLFTSTTPTLLGGESVAQTHLSTLTDSIILLRYVETHGEMRRGIAVLKMRGSMHQKEMRESAIDGAGMHIGEPFAEVRGLLSGKLSHLPGAAVVPRSGAGPAQP